ncbi:MAG: archaellin/type IV pilin N-terminal domain-containing protein [Nanobdellota archaeon]
MINKFLGKKAQSSGIGSLIIFIAMILVAAIAAGVIISTGTILQSKSLQTGHKAKESVSSGLKLLEVYATDGLEGSLDNFYVRTQLMAGSSGFDLNEMVFMLNTQDESYTMRYNDTVAQCDPTHIADDSFNVQFTRNGTRKKDSSYNYTNYLLPGDTIKICFHAQNIQEGERILMLMIPKNGQKLYYETVTPFTFTSKYETLYP